MNYTKQEKKNLVKDVISMGCTTTPMIQFKMLTLFHVVLSKRQIWRYKAEFKKEQDMVIQKTEVVQPKIVDVVEPKKAVKIEKKGYDIVVTHYPFYIECPHRHNYQEGYPTCKGSIKLTANSIQSGLCMQCGYAYNRKEKIWYDINSGAFIKKLKIYDPAIDEKQT